MNARPRIGLNAQLLSGALSYRSAGIHQYLDRLLHHLPAAGEEVDWVVFTHRQARLRVEGMRVRATRWPTVHPPVRIVWEQTAQPVWARLEHLQVLHGMAFVLPLVRPCRTVVTVYDLSFVHFPQLFPGPQGAYLRLFTRLSCRAAGRIIAISESTRHDIAHEYGVAARQIDVAYPGVDPTFRPLPPEPVEVFRRRRGLPETFILHVGTLEPRKNHPALLEAFARLGGPAPRLICVGGAGWFYRDLQATVERLGVQDRVLFAGYVPAEELPLWYNAATLFVYPSLYEGFGMPVLEAMACGRPVITSNVSSLPEAAGPAAVLVAPDDVDGLAEAMQRLLTDRELGRQLSQAGLRHAAQFPWERTAQQTMTTFRRMLMNVE